MEQLYTKDKKLFLYREREIDFINEKIKNLTSKSSAKKLSENKPLTPSVMYFHGVGGLGKSALIYQIENKAKKVKEIKPSVASINFDNNGRYKNDSGKENILRDIIIQLDIDFNFTREELNPDDESIGEKLTKYLKSKKDPRPIILLFDTLESANTENFKWLQENLIAPLLEISRVMVAYAGRKKGQESSLYFPWSIRRHLKFFPLERFTEKQTRDHINKLFETRDVKVPKNVMELTGGIPALNENIADLIIANPDSNSQDYLKNIVEKTIFSDKKEISLYREDLMYVSVLRQFDNRLLDFLIKKLAWRKYEEEYIRSEMVLLQKMLDTTLLENYPDGYGYVFAINYRRMVDSYFRNTKREEHFKVNVWCYYWYTQEVDDGDGVAVADQVYYLLGAWYDQHQYSDLDTTLISLPNNFKLPDPGNRRGELEKLLSSNFEKLKVSNPKRLHTIINKIKRVLEGEEFSWFMAQTEIDELQSVCDGFVNNNQ